MRIRKIVVLLCALVLVLAACSSSPSNKGNGGTPTNSASNNGSNNSGGDTPTTPPEEEDDVNSTPEMDFDLGGKTIKVVAWYDMTPGEDNPDAIAKKKNLEALMEKHNFKMEYINIDFGEYQEKVTASLLAGEPIGDIIRLGKNYTVPALTKRDLLWPVDEYTKNTSVFDQQTTDIFKYEGKTYAFSETRGNLAVGIFYNRTLMNQLGLKPLQQYVDEDNWNWETFIQVSKEANKDTNNDGKLDTWGLASRGLLDHALYSNNTYLTKEDKQNLDDPATVESLNFVSRLATEQVSRPTEGGDWQEPAQFFRQGNTMMYVGAMYEIGGIHNDMPDYDIGFIPFPKGPNATSYYSMEPAFQALAIPKSVSNPEQLIYIWEKMNDIDSIYDYPDQASYESNFSDEKDIANARTVASNLIVLSHGTYPNLGYWDFNGELTSGVSVSTVIEKYKPVFQAAIDEIYNQ